MAQISNQILQVGSRVHCRLYGGDDGIIYAVHGEQHPETVHRCSGVVAMGGNAYFDIVFSGRKTFSYRVPEAIVRGVQWRLLDGIADAEEIAAQIAAAALRQANDRAKADEAKHAFSVEVERLKAAPECGHLKAGERAAVNIRADLKLAFHGVKFSVRSDYSEVRIRWTDGPSVSQVEEIARRYKAGSFNGMDDIYEYHKTPFTEVFGSTQYLSCNRDYTDCAISDAIDRVYSDLSFHFNKHGVGKPTVAQFRDGVLSRVTFEGVHFYGGESVQGEIWQVLHATGTQ